MAQKEFNILGDVDEIQFRLSCGITMLGAIHTAMEEGSFAADSYLDAICCVYDYLSDVSKELRQGINSCEKRARSHE